MYNQRKMRTLAIGIAIFDLCNLGIHDAAPGHAHAQCTAQDPPVGLALHHAAFNTFPALAVAQSTHAARMIAAQPVC